MFEYVVINQCYVLCCFCLGRVSNCISGQVKYWLIPSKPCQVFSNFFVKEIRLIHNATC